MYLFNIDWSLSYNAQHQLWNQECRFCSPYCARTKNSIKVRKDFLAYVNLTLLRFCQWSRKVWELQNSFNRHSMQHTTLYLCYKNDLFYLKARAAMKVLSSRKHYYIKRLFFSNTADKTQIYYENILLVKCYYSQFCRVSNGMSSRNFCVTWTRPSKGSWFFESLRHKTDSTVLLLR